MSDRTDEVKRDIAQLGQNSKWNWKGRLAVYGTAALVSIWPMAKSFLNGHGGDTTPQPTALATGEMNAAQKASQKKDPRTSAEKLAGVAPHDSAACKADPQKCDGYTKPVAPVATAQVAPPAAPASAPQQTPEQIRLAATARATAERHTEENRPKAAFEAAVEQGTKTGLALALTFVVSGLSRKFTKFSLPEHVHGQATPDARKWNELVRGRQEREFNEIHDAKKYVGLSPAAVKDEKANAALKAVQDEIPDSAFARLRAYFHRASPVETSTKRELHGGLPETVRDSSGSPIGEAWYRPIEGTTRHDIATRAGKPVGPKVP